MKNSNIKYLSLVAIVSIGVVLSGCFANDNFTDFSKVAPVVELPRALPGASTGLSLDPAKTDSIVTIDVNVTGQYAPSSDVTLTIGKGDLTLYNSDASHVIGTLLPDDAYTLESTAVVKAGINAISGVGNRATTFTVTFHIQKIPATPGVNYVLPIAIKGAPQGYVVSGNYGQILFNFYHNPYDGTYQSTGTRYNFASSADFAGWNTASDMPNAASTIVSSPTWDFVTGISTVNAENSLVHAGNLDGNFGQLNLKVNADNTVTITSTCPANDGSCSPPQTTLANIAPLNGATSTWDPVTKKFNLYYQYTNPSGTFRVLHAVLMHQ
jgi:Domain of unknown function (DUF1735)/Domain of unknown function (DUF4361)